MYRLISHPKTLPRTLNIHKSICRHKSKIPGKLPLGVIRPQSHHEDIREDLFDKYAKLIKTNPSILYYIDAWDHHKLFAKQPNDFFTTDTLERINDTIMYAQNFEKYFGHIKLYKSPHKVTECYLYRQGDYKNTGCNICETYTWEYNSLENGVTITDLVHRDKGFSVEHLYVDGPNKRIVIHPDFCVDACCG